MSYAQRKQLSGNRALSIFLTVAVVGALLYAIVTGLAYNVIKKAATDLKVIDVEQQPPPPEQPPPPPKDMPKVPPPPVTPPPLVQHRSAIAADHPDGHRPAAAGLYPAGRCGSAAARSAAAAAQDGFGAEREGRLADACSAATIIRLRPRPPAPREPPARR